MILNLPIQAEALVCRRQVLIDRDSGERPLPHLLLQPRQARRNDGTGSSFAHPRCLQTLLFLVLVDQEIHSFIILESLDLDWLDDQ